MLRVGPPAIPRHECAHEARLNMNGRTLLAPAVVSVLIALAFVISTKPVPWNPADESLASGDFWQRSGFSETLAENPTWRAVQILAVVEEVRDPMNILPEIRPGDRINGTYTFDSSAVDSQSANPNSGKYQFADAPFGVILTVGRYTFGTNPRNVEFDIDVSHHELNDRFSFLSRNNTCQPALRHGDRTGRVENISWHLHDFTGARLSGDELPAQPPIVAEWTSPVGLVIDGTVTDRISGAEEAFLIIAKVIRAESLAP